LKRELKTKTTYGYRCDDRLKTNVKESTRLACTPLCAELEHLKIETRLTSETPTGEAALALLLLFGITKLEAKIDFEEKMNF
jgi:hypothetical protein